MTSSNRFLFLKLELHTFHFSIPFFDGNVDMSFSQMCYFLVISAHVNEAKSHTRNLFFRLQPVLHLFGNGSDLQSWSSQHITLLSFYVVVPLKLHHSCNADLLLKYFVDRLRLLICGLRRWCSGGMLDCHAGGPGLILGRCTN